MATEVKNKDLSMNGLVLGENKQVQKVSLKSETMREKLCSIFRESLLIFCPYKKDTWNICMKKSG